jgi:hypothetical protein
MPSAGGENHGRHHDRDHRASQDLPHRCLQSRSVRSIWPCGCSAIPSSVSRVSLRHHTDHRLTRRISG